MKMVNRKIWRVRQERGLDQIELERLAGLAKQRVHKWEKDEGEPTARQAARVAKVLNVPLDWLCDDDAPDEPPAVVPVVAPDEWPLLVQIRELGVDEAARRLARAAPHPAEPVPLGPAGPPRPVRLPGPSPAPAAPKRRHQ